MKRKKVVAVAAVAVMAFNVTGSVYAVGTATKVPVTYDNTVIPDPDHPGTAEWGVAMPGRIVFSDNRLEIKEGLDVELKGVNGYELKPDLKVDVSIKSDYGYQVKYNDTLLPYTLTYTKTLEEVGTPLTGIGNNVLPTFTAGETKLVGKAKLTGTATVKGLYADTLTYTVQRHPETPPA